jgi:hypothetical protein
MSAQVLVPLGGERRPITDPDPEPGEPPLLFDIEIPVRVAGSSPVGPSFFRRPAGPPTTRVSLEDVDLGVSDWRQLAGKDIAFPGGAALDAAAVYLGTVHNPVKLQRIRFGTPSEASIPAVIDLAFDFRCVNPRPPELEALFQVQWDIEFAVVPEE